MLDEAFSVNSVTKLNSIFKAAQDNENRPKLHTVKSLNLTMIKHKDNVERLTINGQNALGDDNLYYFYPDKNSLKKLKRN